MKKKTDRSVKFLAALLSAWIGCAIAFGLHFLIGWIPSFVFVIIVIELMSQFFPVED